MQIPPYLHAQTVPFDPYYARTHAARCKATQHFKHQRAMYDLKTFPLRFAIVYRVHIAAR